MLKNLENKGDPWGMGDVRGFARIMTDLIGPDLRSLVTGLRRDQDASPPASPCAGTPAQSKATSTASR